jgi:hypothetical protein
MNTVPTERTTGVWISATLATILRLGPDGLVSREEIDSLVAGRHRSTGRPPTADHPASEGRRDEHMRLFFDRVASAVSAQDDVLLIGDGEVVEHFADQVRTSDQAHGYKRRVGLEKSGPITDRQLLARMREFAGSPAPRTLPS